MENEKGTKTALVWGAGGGIGLATARHLIRQGWQVLAAGRHVERLEGMTPHLFDTELSQPFSIQSAVQNMAQVCSEVDLWLYAAGDITSATTADASPETWKRILDANLSGAFLATHFSLPLLAPKAHLFYIGAVDERLRLPGLGAYAAAKAGLEAFVDVVRKELRRPISLLRPRAVETALWEKVPFRMPGNALSAQAVAERILQAYAQGENGILELQ